MSLIMAATKWQTNAHLIEDAASLGYLKAEWRTLDPTYGRGKWWERWRPDELVAHDLATDGVDFTDLPYGPGEFDAVAFDPPYIVMGGRTTSTLEYVDRYGILETPRRPVELQAVINQGLDECSRVLKPHGYLLVKCCDYISSGRYWAGTHHTLCHARALGLDLVDRFEHVSSGLRPQSQKRQVHARRNLSTLFVFRKPRGQR